MADATGPAPAAMALLRALVRRAVLVFFTFHFVAYSLFTQRLLPPRLAQIAARRYFHATLPLTYARLVLLPPRAGLWTAADETLFVGAAPIARVGFARRLRRLGVTGVVNMCDEYGGPVRAYGRSNIEQLRLPTIDHAEPSAEDLAAAVAFVERHRAAGGRVYAHCKAGHGRSAAVAYAWLLAAHREETAPYELFETLASARAVRSDLWRRPHLARFHDGLPPLKRPPRARG